MTGAAVLVAVALFLLSRSNGFLLTACCMGMLAIGALAEFRSGRHDRAGTRARSVARPHLGHFRPELFRFNADRRPAHHRSLGLDWNENALAVAAVLFGIGAVIVLTAAGERSANARNSVPRRKPHRRQCVCVFKLSSRVAQTARDLHAMLACRRARELVWATRVSPSARFVIQIRHIPP